MNHKEIGGIAHPSAAETFFPLRTTNVTKVTEAPPNQGGASHPLTGEAFVPFEQTPSARTIRMHEALHLDFTRSILPRDILDQAIEDARLHRYCSGARAVVQQNFPQARMDEIITAHEDVANIRGNQPMDALAGLRAIGILGSDSFPAHITTINTHLGPEFAKDCEKALASFSKDVPTEKQWKRARRILSKYFDENREQPEQPEPGDFPGTEKPKDNRKGKHPIKAEDDSDSDSELDSDNNKPVPAKTKTRKRKKIPKPKQPVVPRRDALAISDNEYRNPETNLPDLSDEDSLVDKQLMRGLEPLSVSIQRLDMSAGSVPNTPGSDMRPATSGSRIFSMSRLVDSRVNPNVKVFARRGGIGGGTILIDASGSMRIPLPVLENFCRKAPAATIALYNAYDLNAGNIFIFAANHRRAASLNCKNWGNDNYIDYQVLRWLFRQAEPRYLVTDFCFTGYWSLVAHKLAIAAYKRKLFVPVRTLDDMTLILSGAEPQRKVRIWDHSDYNELHW